MSTYSISYLDSVSTDAMVWGNHFGANALHKVNIDYEIDYEPSSGFEAALEAYEITSLRYPGGHVENTIDVTRMIDGELRDEVRSFMNWCVENSTESRKYEVTFVLPTKSYVSPFQIESFVYKLLLDYGDVISALEIGNEYSIGTEVRNPDRSIHPEYIDGSQFIAAMNEVEYGEAANRVINAVQNALDKLASENPSEIPDPHILLQMAETNGAASNYKRSDGNGNFDAANEAIVSLLDDRVIDSVDGAVVHYYYNVTREDGLSFFDVEDWREIRMIDDRYESIQRHLKKNVDLFITEWNVVAGNSTQHGASSASVLLEMFEFMVRLNVSDAHVWPLQHRTPNNIMGNRDIDGLEYSMSGAAFSLMANSLRPRFSETGHIDQFESMISNWSGGNRSVEINHYSSFYQEVMFVSLRSEQRSIVNLDLSHLLEEGVQIIGDQLTIDQESSDGLSDFADINGENRISRRVIDHKELALLETLPFFNPENIDHLRIRENQISTYLPPFETILPLSMNPKSINEFYFTSEVDVRPSIQPISLEQDFNGVIGLDLLPFDVVRIVIDNVKREVGGEGADYLIGGFGRDVLLGRSGNDTLVGGEDNDTIKGGNGNDILRGGDGNDILVSGFGNDIIYGGSGHDTIFSSGGADLISSERGNDVIHLESGKQFSAESVAVHAFALRSSYDPWLVSVDGFRQYDSSIYGGGGIDEIVLSDEADALFLENMISDLNDAINRDAAKRLLGVEIIRAGGGDDIIDLTSTRFDDGLIGMELHGQNGNDTLWGSDGPDSLFGGAGDDVLEGGPGADELTGGAGADEFHFFAGDNGHQRILDFSKSEGDQIFFHAVKGSNQSDYAIYIVEQDIQFNSQLGENILSINLQTDDMRIELDHLLTVLVYV